LGLLVHLALVPPASAHPAAAFDGRSPALAAGVAVRYWLWRDANGLHLRWTASGQARRFGGTIAAPGRRIEAQVTAGGAPVEWTRIDDATLQFSATTAGRIAGLDVPDASGTVSFDLALDGSPCPLHTIRLGAGEVRPRHAPVVFDPGPAPRTGSDHHDHPHVHPHPAGLHHHHPHPQPHPPGTGHHHPR